MTNNHGTACNCWQCQMYVVPVEEVLREWRSGRPHLATLAGYFAAVQVVRGRTPMLSMCERCHTKEPSVSLCTDCTNQIMLTAAKGRKRR